jgi:O-antigen/teichoic acid export membrane protein
MVMVEKPTTRNVSNIIISVADVLVVAFFFMFTDANYKHLIYILIIQNVINLSISYADLKVNIKKLRFSISEVAKYMKFGFVIMITLFLMTVNYRIDILMLQAAPNVDKAAIGVYSVGVMLAEKVWLLPDSMKDILLSHLCKGADKEEVSKIIRVSLALTLILVAGVAIMGKPFISILYGSEYDGAYSITVIMLFGVIGMIFYKMVYAYNISQGKRGANLLFLVLAALVNVIGNTVFIPIWGAKGAAFVSVISYTICGIAFLVYFHKKTDSPYKEMLILKRTDLDVIKRLIKR